MYANFQLEPEIQQERNNTSFNKEQNIRDKFIFENSLQLYTDHNYPYCLDGTRYYKSDKTGKVYRFTLSGINEYPSDKRLITFNFI